DHIPGRAAAFALPSDAETLALSQRVVRHALVPAEDAAFGVDNGARARWQVAAQEFPERPLADEADARGVALVVYREPGFAREPPYVLLHQLADGKDAPCELILPQAVEEIGLILVRVACPQQLVEPV